jgi:hypothetical protein
MASVAFWIVLRSIGIVSDRDAADFLHARSVPAIPARNCVVLKTGEKA